MTPASLDDPGSYDAAAPLLLTRDAALREHVLRLAAAAGTTPRCCAEPGSALRSWASAPLVLVGLDVADELAALAPARRAGVHTVGWAPVGDEAFRTALALGAHDVLEVPPSDDWLVGLLGDLGEAGRRADGVGAGRVVGVAGGCGGAGASMLVAALGQVASAPGSGMVEPTLVVDADPVGPGLDHLLGLADHDGVRWEDLARSSGRLGARALREAVPRRAGLGVLTWQPGSAAEPDPTVVREVLAAGRRGHATVVVDLGRAVAPLAQEALGRVDRLLVVTRPGTAAAIATARWCERVSETLPAMVVPLLVLRGSGVDGDRLERATGLPVLLTMGDQRGLDESVDLGLGPARRRRGALARAASEILGLLAARGPSPVGLAHLDRPDKDGRRSARAA